MCPRSSIGKSNCPVSSTDHEAKDTGSNPVGGITPMEAVRVSEPTFKEEIGSERNKVNGRIAKQFCILVSRESRGKALADLP